MATNQWFHRANRPVKNISVLAAAVVILGVADLARRWVQSAAQKQSLRWASVEKTVQAQQESLESLESIVDLKTRDVERLKLAIQGDAQSRKLLYEEGLTLQEEKRLLEKQFPSASRSSHPCRPRAADMGELRGDVLFGKRHTLRRKKEIVRARVEEDSVCNAAKPFRVRVKVKSLPNDFVSVLARRENRVE